MLCEKGMTTMETRSALSVSQSTKQTTSPKTQSNTWKTYKYCTNYGMINYNVKP